MVVPASRRNPPFWLKIIGDNVLIVSTYHLIPKYKTEILAAIDRFKPTAAWAYPSAAFILARWCEEIGRNLPFANLHTSSETVLEEQRKSISSCITGTWIDQYGLTERVSLFAGFNNENYYDYTEYGVTELLQLDNEKHEILGSTLHNYAMPLFRYRTGDIVEARELDDFNRPIIKGLAGRKEDCVILKDGRMIGSLDLVFKGLKNIREGQIYQPSVDVIRLRVVPGPQYTDEDEKKLLRNCRQRINEDVTVKIDYLGSIPKNKDGKFKFVVSDVTVKKDFLSSSAKYENHAVN
jgi:phenylacetate-CoA ligase